MSAAPNAVLTRASSTENTTWLRDANSVLTCSSVRPRSFKRWPPKARKLSVTLTFSGSLKALNSNVPPMPVSAELMQHFCLLITVEEMQHVVANH